MIDDAHIPVPESSGPALPVLYVPSAALAAPTTAPPRQWSDDDVLVARDFFARVMRSTFDALDDVGDSIATAIGLR